MKFTLILTNTLQEQVAAVEAMLQTAKRKHLARQLSWLRKEVRNLQINQESEQLLQHAKLIFDTQLQSLSLYFPRKSNLCDNLLYMEQSVELYKEHLLNCRRIMQPVYA